MEPIQTQREEWLFITTSPTHRRPTEAERSQMRQRVMREIGYTRRKTSARSQTHAEPLHEHSFERPCTSTSPVVGQGLSGSTAVCPSSFCSPARQSRSSLGVPSSLPAFVVCPSALDGESRWLLQHMFSVGTPTKFRIYRDRWYPVCMNSPAAFGQMLASYATHVSKDSPERKLNHFILKSHTRAVAGVRNSLASHRTGDKRTLNRTLSAITALACYSHLGGDMVSWKMHMAAIARLVADSGFALHELDLKVIELVEWVESIGSYVLDTPPALGLAGTRVPDQPSPAEPVPPFFNGTDPPPSLVSAFRALRWTNTQLSLRMKIEGESIWQSPTDIDELIYPLTCRFLQLHTDRHAFSPIHICIRSGALLYLAEFRRRSGISPVVTDIHLSHLCSSLKSVDRGTVKPELILWLLTVGIMEARSTLHQRYLHTQLALLLKSSGIGSSLHWREHIRDIVWLDCLFDWQLDIVWDALDLG
ncbi:hypothetical protein BJX61DRAFT_155124 [Aspergillus egyptiacus]|nr:hypothetical protein BJX61DRAFT_155124 [Aspergillus egyptiacus]